MAKSHITTPIKKAARIIHFLVLAASCSFLPLSAYDKPAKQEQEKQEAVKITEEILVVAPAPREQPLSSVTVIGYTAIDRLIPRDLSDVVRSVPGAIVTFGEKDTFTLKLRGMDSKRIALLVDGVPVYEPYYNSFDLKTVSALGLESVQITRGPSSVLYGPNTLGGIVNVITRRPDRKPFLNLSASLAERNTHNLVADGGTRWNEFSLSGTVSYQDSNGSYYPDPETGKTLRLNSDYQRFNLNAKLYYNPSSRTELMVNGGIYASKYGMPPSLGLQRARYWRFKNWDRYTLNAGGFTSLGEKGTLRFRGFCVNYKNTLNQWRDEAMTILNFESSFDNSVYGLFALADFPLTPSNNLKVSFNQETDIARIQDDVGEPWTKYNQETFSLSAEDHFSISDKCKFIAGLSLDYINKFIGDSKFVLNPLAGLKYTPADYLDLHLSVSGKSRFPSMRSMYSSTSGNPDLLSERGTSFEAGFTFNRGLYLSGAVFFSSFRDMIDSVTLLDGTRQYFNIGQAHINGFEMQAQRTAGLFEFSVSYTFLSHRNETDDRPLDATPEHNLSLNAAWRPAKRLLVDLYGLYGSSSVWYNFSDDTLYDIPGYFNMDAVLSYDFGKVVAFGKVTNLFDDYIYTEPIFPWRSRIFEFGAKVKIGG